MLKYIRSRQRQTVGHHAKPGIDVFIATVEQRVEETHAHSESSWHFIQRISDDFAFIRLHDLRHPLRFLKQISGAPPLQFGVQGFRKEIVDDRNPARHYTAFVFVGYLLPFPLGWVVLVGWEVLGFFRYGFQWSQGDMRCGKIGLRHGRAVKLRGIDVLPGLIEQDLKE